MQVIKLLGPPIAIFENVRSVTEKTRGNDGVVHEPLVQAVFGLCFAGGGHSKFHHKPPYIYKYIYKYIRQYTHIYIYIILKYEQEGFGGMIQHDPKFSYVFILHGSQSLLATGSEAGFTRAGLPLQLGSPQ